MPQGKQAESKAVEVQEEQEAKAFDLKFVGTTVIASLDPNKDGKPLAKFELDLMQVPQEVKDLLK